MKDISDYHENIIHMLAHAFSKNQLLTWVARDINNNCDRVIIGLFYTDEDGEKNNIPLAVLSNEDEDYYEDLDFDYYDKPQFEKEKKSWWQFWR